MTSLCPKTGRDEVALSHSSAMTCPNGMLEHKRKEKINPRYNQSIDGMLFIEEQRFNRLVRNMLKKIIKSLVDLKYNTQSVFHDHSLVIKKLTMMYVGVKDI